MLSETFSQQPAIKLSLQSANIPCSSFVCVPEHEHALLNQLLQFKKTVNSFHKRQKHIVTFDDINRLSIEFGEIMQRLRSLRISSEFESERNKIDDLVDQILANLFKEWVHVAGVGEILYPFYTRLTTIVHQLDSIKESQGYSMDDIQPIIERFAVVEQEIAESGFLDSNLKHHYENLENFQTQKDHLSTSSIQNPQALQENQCKTQPQSREIEQSTGRNILLSLLNRIQRNLRHMSNAASSEIQDCSITRKLLELDSQVSKATSRDDYKTEQILAIIGELGKIDATRDIHGFFPGLNFPQTSAIDMHFNAYTKAKNAILRRCQVDHVCDELNQQVLQLKISLSAIFQFERFSISMDTMRDIERQLQQMRQVKFKSDEFKFSSGPSKLILLSHLIDCNHYVRLIALGIEDISSALVHLYEQLTCLQVYQRNNVLKAMRHHAGHQELHAVRLELMNIEESSKGGLYYGDTSETADEAIPVGQTIIRALIDEIYATADFMEAWIAVFQ